MGYVLAEDSPDGPSLGPGHFSRTKWHDLSYKAPTRSNMYIEVELNWLDFIPPNTFHHEFGVLNKSL